MRVAFKFRALRAPFETKVVQKSLHGCVGCGIFFCSQNVDVERNLSANRFWMDPFVQNSQVEFGISEIVVFDIMC